MLQFLINLLMPIFNNLGVSANDVQTYANMISGHIYAALIVVLLGIAVMIAAHWFAKKGDRHVIRWSAVVAVVLVLTIIVNTVVFGPMHDVLSLMMNASANVSDESRERSEEVIHRIGEEGIVLVKNDGLLPLAGTSKLNVFGWDSISPIFGGTGSGGNASGAIGILEALKEAGFETNQSLTDMYSTYRPERPSSGNGVFYTDWTLPEPTAEYYTEDLMSEAEEFSDVAIITIGRSGGEGKDEPMDMNALIHGTYNIADEVADGNANYAYFAAEYHNNGSYDDFDPGEHYLELSNTEEAMVETVCSAFDKVIVIVNANNTMELGWVNDYDSIKAVLLVPGTGISGMRGLGEILSGAVNPSGRTVDTFVYDLFDTPTARNFGNFSFTNVDDLKASLTAADPAYEGNLAFVDYVEGIYVGYKFYETASDESFINYDEKVLYPFGYGLSYTDFTQSMTDFQADGNNVTFNVSVTNTGNAAGKEVVEVYFTPPYTNGGIEKASVNLVDFAKTAVLEPGQSETVSFTIPYENMASYDAAGIKTANGGYVLEAGTYSVSIRSDSHHVIEEESFDVAEDIDYSTSGRPGDFTAPINQFQDYSAGTVTYLSRADGFANYEEATAAPAESAYIMDDKTRNALIEKSVIGYDPARYDDPDAVMPVTGAQNGIKVSELTGKSYDDPLWDTLLDELTPEEMITLANLGGFQTAAIDSIGKVGTYDSDGPAGLLNWVVGVFGTGFSVETLLAQTWNKTLAEEMGDAVAAEYADSGTYGWYGPAMNIHRSAFAGRNFEYYSEDGTMSGYMAAAVTKGAVSRDVYPYLKHFALNEQETNRCSFLLTYSNEQAIREIYLKPFEMAVKANAGEPLAMMSSFIFIGDVYSGSNARLLNNVLRDEWGFRGLVETDWNGSYGYQLTDNCVRNGNDLMLGWGTYDTNVVSDTASASCVIALRQSAKNILYTVANSGNYTNTVEEGGMDNMTRTFVTVDLIIALLCAAVMAAVLILWRKKRRAGAAK